MEIDSDTSTISAEFTDGDIRALPPRPGNMVLLEAKLNREIGNSAYSLKRDAYLRSSYDSPRRLAEDHEEWTLREIGSRQERMARMATSIWRVEGLS